MAGRMSFPVFTPQEDGHAFDLRTLTSIVPATNLALLPAAFLVTSLLRNKKRNSTWKSGSEGSVKF